VRLKVLRKSAKEALAGDCFDCGVVGGESLVFLDGGAATLL